jgi:hypothetical protein
MRTWTVAVSSGMPGLWFVIRSVQVPGVVSGAPATRPEQWPVEVDTGGTEV